MSTNSNPHNLAIGSDVIIVLVARDHTLIISNAEAVVFKCTICGGTKDIFLHTDKNSYPWLRSCFCGDAGPLSHHAPDAGGDTNQWLAEIYAGLQNCQSIADVNALFVDLQFKYAGGTPT